MSIKPPLDSASASKALKNSQRILILGCPGAGKSYLAQHLSNLLNLPLHSLDQIYWSDNWHPMEVSQFKIECAKLAKEERWIMDGNFGTTFEERWSRADMVIYIDTSPWLAFWRQILRRFGLAKKILRPRNCRERANGQLFWLTYKFRGSHGVLIQRRMRELFPNVEFLHLKKKGEVKNLLFHLSES